MNILARLTFALLALASLGACVGGPLSPWRHATVVALVAPDAIPDGSDSQCVSRLAPGKTATIAVVRLRVGRAPYDDAFVLPEAVALQVGDAVRVRLDTCAIRRFVPAVPAG